MIQDVNAGSIDITNTMPKFSNDVYGRGRSLIMAAPLIQGRYANATMLTFANDVYGQPSTMSAPSIQGGFTSLLLGVEQDATLSSAVRKLPFDD